jgi:Transposase
MLHAGLDLSRRRLDYCLLDRLGDRVEVGAVPPDADGLRGFAGRVADRHGPVGVRAAIESMNGARFVHDTLERCGWEVEVADAQKVKGLAPLACKTDRIDAWVLAELSRRELVPAIWLPGFEQRQERERARWRLFLVRKRSSLKHRIHAQLLAFGHACPVSDLFGRQGRELLSRLDFPEPWRGGVLAAVAMIDELDGEIGQIDRELKALGADHRYIPLLQTVAGVAWVLGYTIAAEDRRRRSLRQPGQAVRLHRPVPERLPVGLERSARPPHARRPQVPALGADGGGRPRLPPRALPRALPAHQAPLGQAARRQGRPGRHRPPPRRGDLAHAHNNQPFAPKGATLTLAA